MTFTILLFTTLLSSTAFELNTQQTYFQKEQIELIEERTPNSKTFIDDQGNKRLRIYEKNIHYFDNKTFIEFDENIYEYNEFYYSKQNNYELHINKNDTKIHLSYKNDNSITINYNKLHNNQICENGMVYSNNNLYYNNSNSFTNSIVIKSYDELYNFSYIINTENLTLKNNLFYNQNDIVYSLGSHYFTSSNGHNIFPDTINVNMLTSNTYKISPKFNDDTFQNELIEYPLVFTSSINYEHNNMNSTFQDKYIINQTDIEVNSTNMLIGKDILQTSTPAGTLINTEYTGIINVEKPSSGGVNIHPDDILSVTLNMKKISNTGTAPNINLYKITNQNLSFENIKGTTILNKSFITTKSSKLSTYSFDITDEMKSSSTNILLALTGTTTGTFGFSSFYSHESSTNASYVEVEYKVTNGCASDYDTCDGQYNNCACYAFQKNVNFLTTQYMTKEEFLHSIKTHVICREIESYNSYILPHERRIAFKYQINHITSSNLNYHFIMQHNCGGWSGMPAGFPRTPIIYGNPETTDNLNSLFINMNNNNYSEIIYLAIY